VQLAEKRNPLADGLLRMGFGLQRVVTNKRDKIFINPLALF
jgi:hypothetical protein